MEQDIAQIAGAGLKSGNSVPLYVRMRLEMIDCKEIGEIWTQMEDQFEKQEATKDHTETWQLAASSSIWCSKKITRASGDYRNVMGARSQTYAGTRAATTKTVNCEPQKAYTSS